jgi:hypothetical protein
LLDAAAAYHRDVTRTMTDLPDSVRQLPLQATACVRAQARALPMWIALALIWTKVSQRCFGSGARPGPPSRRRHPLRELSPIAAQKDCSLERTRNVDLACLALDLIDRDPIMKADLKQGQVRLLESYRRDTGKYRRPPDGVYDR